MEELLISIGTLLTGKSGFIICIVVCEILFSIGSQFREAPGIRHSWILAPAGIAVFFAIAYHLPVPPAGRFSVSLVTLAIFLLSILFQWIILDLSFWRVLFNSIAAYALENLAVDVYEIAVYFTGVQDAAAALVHLAVLAVVYTSSYFYFARRTQHAEIKIKKSTLIYLALITIFISNFLFSFFSSVFADSARQVSRIPLAFCCLLALELQFGTFEGSNLNQEKELLEQLLYREQRQHRLMQETIDIINMKSHDLKKQIRLLRDYDGADTARMIRQVEKAVTTYDSLVDTGNRNLDIIISEEKLLCNQYNIPFDVMADGAVLAFMPPEDLFSMIGNALRNAVENSLKEEGRRNINLDIHRAGRYICIEISNYCTQEIKFSNGLPATSKADSRYHGFGLKSMQYVVKKYGGNMVIQYQNDTFLIKILLPVQETQGEPQN